MSVEIKLLGDAEKEEYFELWENCFGDSRESVEEFHECFGNDLKCFVLTLNDKIKAELSLFKMGELAGCDLLAGRNLFVSYAVCTDSKSRNQGLGSEITEYARNFTLDGGFVSALSPADRSLIEFYEQLHYKSIFKEIVYRTEACSGEFLPEDMIEISAEEYNEKREKFLKDRLHIKLSENTLRYVKICSGSIGLWSLDGGKAICACEDTGDEDILEVTELLTDYRDSMDQYAVSDMMSRFTAYLGKKSCIYHMPSDSEEGKVQAMISLPLKDEDLLYELKSCTKAPWFGFSFA